MTESQIKRVSKDFTKYAQEEIEVQNIGGVLYAFGSEIATLRLLKAYRTSDKANQGYSDNLNTFFFSLAI